MIKKIKVMTIVGTRPEIIRLSRVITLLDKNTDHVLVHTGQNYDYELNEVFFKELELRKPDYFLNAAQPSASATIGQIIMNIDPILDKEKPDALLILGDTNSALAAMPAKRKKIPIFHMEAGNRCFDQRVPEEINRKIVDHISDINLPYSDISREYLLREGLPPQTVIKTGSPMYEVLAHNIEKINASDVLGRLNLEKYNYFIVSCHREENVDSDQLFEKFNHVLNTLASTYNKRIIVSTHPRTRKRIDAKGLTFNPLVEFLKPLGFLDYVHLQQKAFMVLSDSGTITEESSILNFPALNLREAHERPEGMEEASVVMTGMNIERILQSIEIISHQPRGTDERLLKIVKDYDVPNVSDKVLRIILSYTDYVKKTVWKMTT